MDMLRQSVYLVVNQIEVYSYGFLFNWTTVVQASDPMTECFNPWVCVLCLSLNGHTVAQIEFFVTLTISDFINMFWFINFPDI